MCTAGILNFFAELKMFKAPLKFDDTVPRGLSIVSLVPNIPAN